MTTITAAFPDETVQVGQRITKTQAEILNRLILDEKHAASSWRKIDDKTPNGTYLLYFPAIKDDRNGMLEMWAVGHHPVHYPRKPTHYMVLTKPQEHRL